MKYYSVVKQHMVEKGPPAPTPKPFRAKSTTQVKKKEPSQKIPPKQNPSRATHLLEPRVVIVLVVPVEQTEDQAPLYPPNQLNQLPDNPPDEPNQLPNNPLNPPNLHLFHQTSHQINQINHLTIHQTLHLFHQTFHHIYQINHLTLQQIYPIQCSHKTLHSKYHN